MGFVKDYIGLVLDEHRIVMLNVIRNSSSLVIGSIITLELFCYGKKRPVNFRYSPESVVQLLSIFDFEHPENNNILSYYAEQPKRAQR